MKKRRGEKEREKASGKRKWQDITFYKKTLCYCNRLQIFCFKSGCHVFLIVWIHTGHLTFIKDLASIIMLLKFDSWLQ